jgi:hypothetical protein
MKQTAFKILTLLIYLLSFFYGHGQAIRQQITSLTDSISKDNMLKSRGVGYGGVRTKQWENFEKLSTDATTEELALLTDHKNGVVRSYSFQALAGRKGFDFFPILLRHLNDTAEIRTFQGCIISSQLVGDYFLDVVTPGYVDNDLNKLTEEQKKVIDSILLFDKSIRINAKYHLLRNLKPETEFYQRVKEIATTEKSPVSILALARFQNKDDIPIMQTLFKNENTEYYGAYAAREFPDTLFYSYLKKVFEQEWAQKLYDYPKWRILYQALAKYPSETTYKLFERTTKTKDDFRYQTLGKYLTIAIRKYPNEIYKPLLSKIKLEKYYLDDVEDEMNIEK